MLYPEDHPFFFFGPNRFQPLRAASVVQWVCILGGKLGDSKHKIETSSRGGSGWWCTTSVLVGYCSSAMVYSKVGQKSKFTFFFSEKKTSFRQVCCFGVFLPSFVCWGSYLPLWNQCHFNKWPCRMFGSSYVLWDIRISFFRLHFLDGKKSSRHIYDHLYVLD